MIALLELKTKIIAPYLAATSKAKNAHCYVTTTPSGKAHLFVLDYFNSKVVKSYLKIDLGTFEQADIPVEKGNDFSFELDHIVTDKFPTSKIVMSHINDKVPQVAIDGSLAQEELGCVPFDERYKFMFSATPSFASNEVARAKLCHLGLSLPKDGNIFSVVTDGHMAATCKLNVPQRLSEDNNCFYFNASATKFINRPSTSWLDIVYLKDEKNVTWAEVQGFSLIGGRVYDITIGIQDQDVVESLGSPPNILQVIPEYNSNCEPIPASVLLEAMSPKKLSELFGFAIKSLKDVVICFSNEGDKLVVNFETAGVGETIISEKMVTPVQVLSDGVASKFAVEYLKTVLSESYDSLEPMLILNPASTGPSVIKYGEPAVDDDIVGLVMGRRL